MSTRGVALTLRSVPLSGYVLGGTLSALSVVSWIVVANANMPMAGMLDVSALVFFTIIWAVGMVAMMFPSLIPMAYMVGVSAHAGEDRTWNWTMQLLGPALFVLGYVGVWTLVGVTFYIMIALLGVLGQPFTVGLLGLAGGAILIATGIYQFTRFKLNALMKCRSPMGFMMTRWRGGRIGSVLMGADYGLFCTKCCWVLMVGLLIVGAMSLPLMGVFAVIIFAEKIGPFASVASKLVGVGFIVSGLFLAI